MEVVMSLATCEGALRASENNPWVELSFFYGNGKFYYGRIVNCRRFSDSFVQPVRRAKMLPSRLYSIFTFLSS